LKFVVAKIKGDAKDKLLAHVERHAWKQIKGILEENYVVKRTLKYYTALFNSRQAPPETVAQWGVRLDRLAMDLPTEARQRLVIYDPYH
jgi:predicted ATPase